MRKIKIFNAVLLLSLLVPGLSSCGNHSTSDTSFKEEVHVESITVTASQDFVKVGQSLKLTVTVLPSNVTTTKDVDFSSDSEHLSVTSDGTVTGVSIGEGNIIVTSKDNQVTGSIHLKVVSNSNNGYLSVSEYGEKLASTPYTISDIGGQEKYGLSDGGNVGVIEDNIKELYSCKSDTEFDVDAIINVENIDLSQVNKYFDSISQINDYYRIQTAIYLAKDLNSQGKEAKIKLPKRTMNVDASLSSSVYAFVADGLNGTYFEGDETVICLSVEGTSWKGYFNFSNSENIHLNGFTMKLAVPSSLTGTIVDADVDAKTIKLSVSSEFNDLIEKVQTNSQSIRSWVEFDANTKAPLQNGNFLVDAFKSYSISGNATDGYQLTVNFKNTFTRSRNGSLVSVSFSQYDAHGLSINSCNNVYVENVTMNHASGMGFVSSGTRNLYINRFNLQKEEDSSLLMTATADAMHFNTLHDEVKITNSLIEYSHDDALNIKHGYFYKLTDAEGGSTKSMTLTRLTSNVETPQPGDKIAVYDESTFESYNPTAGYYTINTVTPTSNGYQVTVKERMSNVGEWGTARVTFISNTPNFEFSNNIIRNKRNRGIIVQVPGAKIVNNTFMNVGHGSIQAATAMDVYNEATLPQDLTISNNKFINNCYIKPEPLYGDIAIFAIANNGTVAPAGTLANAKISNNFITKNGNAAISIRGVGDSNITDNFFYECSRTQPSGAGFNCLLHAYNCDNITLDGNYNEYTLDNGLSGIILQGKTSQNMLNVLDSNTNIEFQRNDDAGPEVEVKKTSNSIVIDGDLSDWSSDLLDIQIDGCSDAEGTKRTMTELSDHFAVKTLKMTYDNEAIYLCFDVFDNQLNVKTINDFWLGDCVELFMSTITNMPTADLQVYKEEGGVLQAAFAPGWESQGYCTLSSVRTNKSYLEKKSMISSIVNTTSAGYVGEVKIPFTLAPEFKEAIDADKPIDMAIIVADAERNEISLKRIQAGNVPHFVEDYKTKTARMPQYYFK